MARDFNPFRRRPGPFGVVALLAALAAGGWALANRPWEAKPIAVNVETAASGPATRVLAVNGRITPRHEVDISSTVSGRILKVLVAEGDALAAAAPMAVLDDAQQKAAVDQAVAALDAARAQLAQAKVDFDRAVALGENISRRDLDAQRLSLKTAEDDVRRLTAAQTQAQALLSQYEVLAPFAGTVLIRAVDPGQVVAPSNVLFTYANLDQLEAEASIDEIYSAAIRRGLTARLQPSGYNTVLEGAVDFVAPKVDTATGGRLVRVSIADLDGLHLPIGLTVNINIVVDELSDAITAPRSAIVSEDGASFVYLAADGRATRRPVEYVDWPAARLVVTSGLAAGDVVITDPKSLSEGVPVRPVGG